MGKTTGLLLVLAALIMLPRAQGQEFSVQGNNEMRWADGTERLGGEERAKRYFEDRLNLDFYYGSLRMGARFTMLQPSEFGEQRTGEQTLDKRFIEYDDPDVGIRLRAGDFYTVWGRGLTLALVEDINQGFDSGLDGFFASANYGALEAEVISGRSEAGILGYVREAQVSGGHVGAYLPFGLTLGGQAVLVSEVENANSYEENKTYGGYVAYDGAGFSLWGEHAREFVDGVDEDYHASYLSGSFYLGRFAAALDYKRYHYHLYGSGLGGGAGDYAQSINILPFHSAPIVQREFTSNLLSKHPHIVRFDDEVGLQAELTYSFGTMNTLILNLNQSSSFVEEDAWVPSLDEERSPSRTAYLELNAYPGRNWYLIGWTGWSEDLVYREEQGEGTRVFWEKRTAAGMTHEIGVLPEWTAKLSGEGLYVDDLNFDEQYYDALFILGATYQSSYSVAVTYEMTTQENPSEGRSNWVKLDATAFIANRHELLLTVGQERGGLVCTSGKCRLVTPFNGVKLTWTTLF